MIDFDMVDTSRAAASADFETHVRGTYEEIRESRALAREIDQTITQYGAGIIPHNILEAYTSLCKVYNKHMQGETI